MMTDQQPKAPVEKKDRAWGIGIAIFYSAFVVVVVGLVFFASLQRFDLVADNYYEDGIKYQSKLDQMKLAESAQYEPGVTYKRSAKQLELAFPAAIHADSISGRVVLFRPSNAALDRHWDLDLDNTGKQLLDLHDFRKGSWKVMIKWKAGAADLYTERSIFVE